MLTLLLVLAAAPAPKVAVPGFSHSGFEQAVSDALVDRLATQLAASGLKMTTRSDLTQLLGLERQQKLAGCSGESSCLAELIGGLGVDALLTGSVVKVGESFTATLRVLKTQDGREVISMTTRAKNSEVLQDWLDAQAPLIANALLGSAPATSSEVVPPAAVERSAPLRIGPLVTTIGGAVCAGIGLTLFLFGKDDAAALSRRPPPSLEDISRLEQRGALLEGVGVSLLVAGAVVVAASVVWWIAGREASPVAWVPAPGGSALVWNGDLP